MVLIVTAGINWSQNLKSSKPVLELLTSVHSLENYLVVLYTFSDLESMFDVKWETGLSMIGKPSLQQGK